MFPIDEPSDSCRFGLPMLDEALGGGIPRGTFVILEDISRLEGEWIAIQFLREGLKSGEWGYIFGTDHHEAYFDDRLSAAGSNPKILKDMQKLRFIDGFLGPLGGTLAALGDSEIKVNNLSNPRECNEGIRRAMLHLEKKEALIRGIISSLSSILHAMDNMKSIVSFIHQRVAHNKIDNSVTLAIVHRDAHSDMMINTIEHLVDVVIRMDVKRTEEGKRVAEVQVIKVRGRAQINTNKFYYLLTDGGFRPFDETEEKLFDF